MVQLLREDFRHRLQYFYARLQLAPPYQSVEKAIAHLTTTLKALPPEEQEQISTDPSRKWTLYGVAFVESGLNQKHRGIITSLIRSKKLSDLPEEYSFFLKAFLP